MLNDTTFDGLLVIPVVIICFLVGYVIKNYTKISNKSIPLIMMVLGMVINVSIALIDENCVLDLMTFVSGAVSGLASTGSYELIRNTLNIRDIPPNKKTGIDYSEEIISDDEISIDDNE